MSGTCPHSPYATARRSTADDPLKPSPGSGARACMNAAVAPAALIEETRTGETGTTPHRTTTKRGQADGI